MNHGELEHQRIAQLAYDLWQKRGCPIGSPDEDWFRVENELRPATGECLPRGPDRTVTSTGCSPIGSRAALLGFENMLSMIEDRIKSLIASRSTVAEMLASAPTADFCSSKNP